mmetsp:Transcript_26823/g.36875  ORF Transcript_26823/g.36875 Transcript_26823/m.36875 type:complete len:91 (+) Transcript_26823:878-1150(+)
MVVVVAVPTMMEHLKGWLSLKMTQKLTGHLFPYLCFFTFLTIMPLPCHQNTQDTRHHTGDDDDDDDDDQPLGKRPLKRRCIRVDSDTSDD